MKEVGAWCNTQAILSKLVITYTPYLYSMGHNLYTFGSSSNVHVSCVYVSFTCLNDDDPLLQLPIRGC